MTVHFTLATIAIITVILLLGIGFYAFLFTRNMIKIVVALQILAKAAMLLLIVAGRLTNKIDIGQSMALTVIVADTIVAVVALALAVQVRRHYGTLDVKQLTNLRR